MPPVFFFRIDKLRADPAQVRMANGVWLPPRPLGSNTRRTGDSTGVMFFHNGSSTSVWEWDPPPGFVPYKTLSMYHNNSQFYAVPYDAIGVEVPGGAENEENNGDDDEQPEYDWHTIQFVWPLEDDATFTSAVHIAGDQPTLYVRKQSQTWAEKLFPDNMLPTHVYPPSAQDFGGLVGDISVFLGMLALSTTPNRVQAVVEHCLQGNPWRIHNRPRREGWTDGRGVVVYVWTLQDHWQSLQSFESGTLGKFYY